jgi:hypothetical protein
MNTCIQKKWREIKKEKKAVGSVNMSKWIYLQKMSDQVVLFLMPHKIQKRRYDDMTKAAKARNINVLNRLR